MLYTIDSYYGNLKLSSFTRTQRTQYPLIKEYTFNHNIKASII